MTTDRIERDIFIQAAPESVWPFVADPGFWASDDETVSVTARAGQHHTARHSQHGDFPIRVEEVHQPRYVAYRWVSAFSGHALNETNSTLVEFTLTPEGDGTRLRVIESGFQALPTSEANRENVIRDHTKGWDECLAQLVQKAT